MPYSNVLPLRDSPSARLTDHPRQTAFTPRPGKRARHRSNDMEVAEDERAQTGTAQPSPEGSDSSDWEDWANAMVVQGEAADGEAIARESEGREADSSTGPEAEEEAWMKRMMDQGTDRSVVQDADSRAWDYVLQMAVEAERSLVGAWSEKRWERNPEKVQNLRRHSCSCVTVGYFRKELLILVVAPPFVLARKNCPQTSDPAARLQSMVYTGDTAAALHAQMYEHVE